MQCIFVEGLLFETLETDDLNHFKIQRDSMLQAIGSPRFALYQHIVRRKVRVSRSESFPDDFSSYVDDRWHKSLRSKELFLNELYLTIVRRPAQGRAGFLDRLFSPKLSRTSIAANLANEHRELNAARDAIMASLSNYRPSLLGCYREDGIVFSDVLEFLATQIDGRARPVQLPLGDAGHALANRRVSFGAQTVEFGPFAEHGREFAGIVSIKDYPASTAPGMLDNLLRLPLELLITQSFSFMNRQVALNRVNLTIRRMRAGDDEAISLRDQLTLARDDLAAGRAVFGEHHMTVTVRGSEVADVDSGVAEVQAAMADLGIIAVREDIALEPAFWSQFPGNFHTIPRRSVISGHNLSGLASLHNFPTGRPEHNHWGDSVTVLETTAASPYHFNFHQGDLGNFTLIGPSGSGKTVVLNFLLAQAQKFSPDVFFFDKDRGAEIFIRAIGGSYGRLRSGEPSGLNPLLLPDTPANRTFLLEWVSRLVSLPGRSLSTDETDRLRDAIDANMMAPPHYRRLGHFVHLLRGGERPHPDDLASRLQSWSGSGDRAWLFDNETDNAFSDRRVVGFDMTTILDDPILRTPAMMYLFHRVEERLDGKPTIIVVDEGWKALDDEVFTARIRDWEKTIRKRNGIVGFATQSAEDALTSRISSAIIEQAATQIFMANPKAQARDYVQGFGLTEHEFELVKSIPSSSHAFLVKHGNDSVVAKLDLSGETDILTVLSGRESTIRLLDGIRETAGDDPAEWMPCLLAATR